MTQLSETLRQKLRARTARTGVVGLGYVGLPLAVELAKAGFHATGIDLDARKVDAINEGRSYIPDVRTADVQSLHAAGRLDATTDFAVVRDLDTVNICVPTPLRKTKDPDMSYIVSAVEGIAKYLHPGMLIVLESTTYPGTTDEVVQPMLEAGGLKAGVDFYLAFSPERVDPGNPTFQTHNVPKVVGGFTPTCSDLAKELYGSAIETRFVRDLEQVPAWAMDGGGAEVPRTIQDATFVESRLHSLRTRNAAAYKGIYSLLLGNEARDWMEDKALDKVQYATLETDIHHIFPRKWCIANEIDEERRESIVNKTAITARTNRTIGGSAPSKYLAAIESKAQIPSTQVDGLLESHLIPASELRADDFSSFFVARRERLCELIENAMGKRVQRDVDEGHSTEGSEQFEIEVEDRDALLEI